MKRLLILFTVMATAVNAKGNVKFNTRSVTLSCPGKIHNCTKIEGKSNGTAENGEYVIENFSGVEQYKCSCPETKSRTYAFYIKGKVCDNCIDLDATLAAGVILGDLLVTGGVMLTVYMWAQRRMRSGATPSKTKNAQRNGNGQSPTYEDLIPGTRSNDMYEHVGQTSRHHTG